MKTILIILLVLFIVFLLGIFLLAIIILGIIHYHEPEDELFEREMNKAIMEKDAMELRDTLKNLE